MTEGAPVDPVRRRRQQIATWNGIAKRVGYLALLVALIAFAVALVGDFTATMAAIIVASLVVGLVLLAPSIIVGYAVKAAERDDRERGL